MTTTLLLLGATGLVGRATLVQALAEPRVGRIVAPTRRPLPGGDRVENPVVDFAALPAQAAWWRADAVICTLGTTLRQAGSQAAFRAVDYGHVMAAARLARDAGTPCFVLNSSLGAHAAASTFYLRVKGELERDLGGLGFDSFTTVRPSFLDGGPRPDKRPGEAAALWMGRLLGPLLPRRIRPVPVERVAAALLAAALTAPPGFHAVESHQLLTP
jgi:uncharacterized protein YbjT (DUF2867 family)